MSGCSLNHGTLVHALHIALGNGTEGTPCVSHGSEIKLRIEAANAYYYPDAMVVCGEVDVESETDGVVTNPAIVFEVLSPGTQGYDKDRKFLDYQTVPSVREIVFLSSERKLAERYERQDGRSWRYTAYLGDVRLPLDAGALSWIWCASTPACGSTPSSSTGFPPRAGDVARTVLPRLATCNGRPSPSSSSSS